MSMAESNVEHVAQSSCGVLSQHRKIKILKTVAQTIAQKGKNVGMLRQAWMRTRLGTSWIGMLLEGDGWCHG